MRPRPMKPHVAKFEPVEAKDRRVVVGTELVAGPLPSMHSREGEKRIETAALIVNPKK